jgi:hypothetical protein
MVHRVAKVDVFGMGLVQGLAVDGAAQGLRALLADPLATDETLQDLGHGVISLRGSKPGAKASRTAANTLTNRAVG